MLSKLMETPYADVPQLQLARNVSYNGSAPRVSANVDKFRQFLCFCQQFGWVDGVRTLHMDLNIAKVDKNRESVNSVNVLR